MASDEKAPWVTPCSAEAAVPMAWAQAPMASPWASGSVTRISLSRG